MERIYLIASKLMSGICGGFYVVIRSVICSINMYPEELRLSLKPSGFCQYQCLFHHFMNRNALWPVLNFLPPKSTKPTIFAGMSSKKLKHYAVMPLTWF